MPGLTDLEPAHIASILDFLPLKERMFLKRAGKLFLSLSIFPVDETFTRVVETKPFERRRTEEIGLFPAFMLKLTVYQARRRLQRAKKVIGRLYKDDAHTQKIASLRADLSVYKDRVFDHKAFEVNFMGYTPIYDRSEYQSQIKDEEKSKRNITSFPFGLVFPHLVGVRRSDDLITDKDLLYILRFGMELTYARQLKFTGNSKRPNYEKVLLYCLNLALANTEADVIAYCERVSIQARRMMLLYKQDKWNNCRVWDGQLYNRHSEDKEIPEPKTAKKLALKTGSVVKEFACKVPVYYPYRERYEEYHALLAVIANIKTLARKHKNHKDRYEIKNQWADSKREQTDIKSEIAILNTDEPLFDAPYIYQKLIADESSSPMHVAAFCGSIIDLCYWYSKSKESLEQKDIYGRTPFHLAALSGNTSALLFLARMCGAYVHAADIQRNRGLHYAAQSYCEEMVDACMELKMDLQPINKKKETPEDVAKKHGAKWVRARLKGHELLLNEKERYQSFEYPDTYPELWGNGGLKGVATLFRDYADKATFLMLHNRHHADKARTVVDCAESKEHTVDSITTYLQTNKTEWILQGLINVKGSFAKRLNFSIQQIKKAKDGSGRAPQEDKVESIELSIFLGLKA